MDLLYSGNVEGFAIVSSDSDFTPLATRLRESGKRVIGVGPAQDAEGVRRGLREVRLPRGAPGASATPGRRRPSRSKDDQPRPIQSVLTKALNKVDSDDDDWTSLGRARQPPEPHRPVVRLPQLRLRQAQRPGQGPAVPRDQDRHRRRAAVASSGCGSSAGAEPAEAPAEKTPAKKTARKAAKKS